MPDILSVCTCPWEAGLEVLCQGLVLTDRCCGATTESRAASAACPARTCFASPVFSIMGVMEHLGLVIQPATGRTTGQAGRFVGIPFFLFFSIFL